MDRVETAKLLDDAEAAAIAAVREGFAAKCAALLKADLVAAPAVSPFVSLKVAASKLGISEKQLGRIADDHPINGESGFCLRTVGGHRRISLPRLKLCYPNLFR